MDRQPFRGRRKRGNNCILDCHTIKLAKHATEFRANYATIFVVSFFSLDYNGVKCPAYPQTTPQQTKVARPFRAIVRVVIRAMWHGNGYTNDHEID